jgi:hypothetical protein
MQPIAKGWGAQKARTAEDDAALVPSWRMFFYAPDGVLEGVLLGE